MKTLHLILSKKWFDMIEKGEKKVEYRNDNQYWDRRLLDKNGVKHFDRVIFRNGYGKNRPALIADITLITKNLIWEEDKPELKGVISTLPFVWEIHFKNVRRLK